MSHDVLVIGAGLAGLMAGIQAAVRGKSVLVLERGAEPCLRYLASGSGAAPVSNAGLAIERFHGKHARFVSDALKAFGAAQLHEWFAARGVQLREAEHYGHIVAEGGGAAVRDALLASLRDAGGELLLERPATHVAAVDEGFAVDADGLFVARALVLAGGSGARIAEAFGHTVAPLFPAQTTIEVAERLGELNGLWMDVRLALLTATSRNLQTTGSMQFTEQGLSGEAVFNLSREVAPRLAAGERLELLTDFYPGMSQDEVAQWLYRTLGGSTRERAADALDRMLPTRLAEMFLREIGAKPSARSRDLEKRDREGLLQRMKATRLTVTGVGGMDVAEGVTGGVSVREVDPRNFESKLKPGLFVVGAMLDTSGDWGGFEQHFALASGWLSGQNACRRSK